MTESLLPRPEACSPTLDAIQANPLAPGPEPEAHMMICRACAEARVAYLAQEDFPAPVAPAGYFDRLPDRVLRKLPAKRTLWPRIHPFAWAAAAALLMAVGAGAFWAGRANRTPLVEAHLAQPSADLQELLPDTPFQETEDPANEDALSRLTALSEEDANTVMRTLGTQTTHPPVTQ